MVSVLSNTLLAARSIAAARGLESFIFQGTMYYTDTGDKPVSMYPAHGKDFYKSGHREQYPAGTEIVYSNLTARSNKHFQWNQAGKGYVVLFGLQAFIEEFLVEWWTEGFFKMPKDKAIKKYKRRIETSVGPMDLKHLEDLHDLGHLPVNIKALPEGTLVPIGIPMFTIVNTHTDFGWVTNMLETLISCELWKPITVATIAYEYRKLCNHFSDITCDNDDHIPFQCHDFSMRGLSGVHDASVVGSAHLASFVGTDTPLAIDRVEQYYGTDTEDELIGASVPATEHSVMCMGGKDGEEETVKRFLTELYPTGIFSCVLDTWDFFKVLTVMLPNLKDIILKRDGKFVVRPDSGDPVKIICGYKVDSGYDHLGKTGNPFKINWKKADAITKEKGLEKACMLADSKGFEAVEYFGKFYDVKTYTEVPEAEIKGAIELLWELFRGHVNDKGYKVLDEHIGLIYGDSITLGRAKEIFDRLTVKKFATSNVVFGVGSFTYQYITRDTFGMAIKATWGQVEGEGRDIQKDPATDDGTKKSLCGRVNVFESGGILQVKDQCSPEEEKEGNLLRTVFLNGEMYNQTTFTEIRQKINESL